MDSIRQSTKTGLTKRVQSERKSRKKKNRARTITKERKIENGIGHLIPSNSISERAPDHTRNSRFVELTRHFGLVVSGR